MWQNFRFRKICHENLEFRKNIRFPNNLCPGRPVLSVLSRGTGRLVQPNLPRLSCPSCLVLSQISGPSCPAPAVLPRLSCLGCPASAVLQQLTCQVDLSKLTFPGFPAPLSHLLSCPRCPVLSVLSWLSCHDSRVPVVTFQLSSCCHFQAALFSFPACLSHPNFLLWLSCPGCLIRCPFPAFFPSWPFLAASCHAPPILVPISFVLAVLSLLSCSPYPILSVLVWMSSPVWFWSGCPLLCVLSRLTPAVLSHLSRDVHT